MVAFLAFLRSSCFLDILHVFIQQNVPHEDIKKRCDLGLSLTTEYPPEKDPRFPNSVPVAIAHSCLRHGGNRVVCSEKTLQACPHTCGRPTIAKAAGFQYICSTFVCA